MTDIELKIGDNANAITIIQNSQTDALKALAEFVENSIDASAKKCEIIRKKIKGSHAIIIKDDGSGFAPNQKGLPDFDRALKNICNSIKRNLTDDKRDYVQGQFGIGLLGFSAIGETLEILSKNEGLKVAKMTLKRGEIKASTEELSLPNFEKGTQVTIWPIHKTEYHKLTLERISKYIGEELAERIKTSGLKIFVSDPHKKVTKEIKPLSFEGPRLKRFDKVMTNSGCNIHFDLHECSKDKVGKIAIVRRGTKILDNISEIEEFDCEPWNKGVVEGKIDYKKLEVPPTTRRGILRDKEFEEFLRCCKSIEPDLSKEIELIERKREEKVDPKFIKKIKDTFQKVMDELGENYAWFGSPTKGALPSDKQIGVSKSKPVAISFGPLYEVKIKPMILEIAPNETKKIIARAFDEKGGVIISGVKFSWSLKDNIVSINPNNDELEVKANDKHLDESTTVTVVAKQGDISKENTSQLIILDERSPKKGGGLNILFENAGLQSYRSLFENNLKLIKINKGHRDYKEIEKKGVQSTFRYVCSLVAKELAYYNHKGEGEEKVLESFIEIIAAYEKVSR